MSKAKNNLVTQAFTVIQPGILSLLQDSGRFGKHNIGLTNGGPLDKQSFDWANRLLNNDNDACVIEASIGGLVLKASMDTQIAITGGDAEVSINQTVVDSWQTHNIKIGDTISFGFAKTNTRHYLAVKGGFQTDAMFGSRATVVREKLGGIDGNALKAGDEIPCLTNAQNAVDSQNYSVNYHDRPSHIRSNDSSKNINLRVVLAYQHKTFTDLQKARFFNHDFTLTDKCDRMGFRLSGPSIQSSLHTNEGGMLSEGICYGAIQIPADGQAIVLLNDRQTIGGYPKIGSVFSLDIPKLTQRLPGTKLSFEAITMDEAQQQLLLADYRYKNYRLNQVP